MVITTAETIGEERLRKYWFGVKEVLTMKDLQRELEVLTMKDLQRALEVLREKLVVLESRIKEEQNNDDEWPKNGDSYWCERLGGLGGGSGVLRARWVDHSVDFHRKATGNCFRTREEAEFHLERLKVMAELERLSDGDRPTDVWVIVATSDNELHVKKVVGGSITPFTFNSGETAFAAIRKIGEERLKKYWFGIKGEIK